MRCTFVRNWVLEFSCVLLFSSQGGVWSAALVCFLFRCFVEVVFQVALLRCDFLFQGFFCLISKFFYFFPIRTCEFEHHFNVCNSFIVNLILVYLFKSGKKTFCLPIFSPNLAAIWMTLCACIVLLKYNCRLRCKYTLMLIQCKWINYKT